MSTSESDPGLSAVRTCVRLHDRPDVSIVFKTVLGLLIHVRYDIDSAVSMRRRILFENSAQGIGGVPLRSRI